MAKMSIDAVIVPPGGVLVISLKSDTLMDDVRRIQTEASVFFAPHKVLVLRAGDMQIGCISWDEDAPEGVSAEGAAWATDACPKCGGAATPIVSPLHHSKALACQRCGHVWVDALAEEQRGEFTETEPW